MKKNFRKAVARRMGATLMAFVLLVAAITPAGEAFASEFEFGGGIFDAVKSAEETQPVIGTSEQVSSPEFSFGGGKEIAEEELPVYTEPPVQAPAVTPDAAGDEAEPAAEEADVTVEQGGSARYELASSRRYSYTISPSVTGLTVTAGGYGDTAYVTVSASEDVPAGIYTVTYTRYNSTGSFTVEVTAPEGSGDSGVGTPEVEEIQPMTMDKVATEILDENGNPTGAYDLSLSISGSVGSETRKAMVDVIFIVDNSNSMYDNNRYMQSLRPAMQALITNLSTTNAEKIDARYAIAMFGTNSEIRLNFTNANAAYTSIGNISQYSNQSLGGTNYQGGIYQGKLLLNTVREGATSIVIFVTDGLPTYRGAPNANAGSGSNDNDGRNIAAAVTEIGSMNCNYFYCIGIGNNFTNTNRTEYQNMQKLTSAVNAETTGIHSVSATNVSGLTNVFNNISAEVTSFLCSDVTVTDTLSNVSGELLVEVSDPSSVKVEVIKDGTTIAGPASSVNLDATEKNAAATLSATYADGVLKLEFPDDYQLEAGYTYKLHAVIEPTDEAYDYYRENGYDGVGAAGSGTHAGEEGIYSNKSATVSYTYKDVPGTATYNHPVIQLYPADLTITKQIVGMDTSVIETLQFPLTLTSPDGTVTTNTILLSEFDYDEATDTYSIVLEDLTPGTTYSISENGGEVAGYTIETTVNGTEGKDITGTLELDEQETVAYINTYVKSDEDLVEGDGTLSISGQKVWDDNDDASKLRPEEITVTLQGTRDGETWEDIETVTVTPDADGNWEFDFEVSSYTYVAYRFEEIVPEYYEATYQQPAYSFTYPSVSEWSNETSCKELEISGNNDEKTVIISKKGSDFYIWSYDALTPGEQQLIVDSFSQVDSSFKAENAIFYYGQGSTIEGITVTADKIIYLNPNKWSYVYMGSYSRGSESTNVGVITNKLSSTDVTVTKEVSGNLGDRSLDFEFTAVLSSGAFAEGEGYTVSEDGSTATFNLKHDENVVLKNVPLGAELTITEESSGYAVTVKVGETEYDNGAAIKVEPDMVIDIHNHLSEGVETGIVLDSMPYIMMLLIAGAAFFFVILRKRMAFED